ncbi:MAG: ParB/RepB/Spo0J family partition protein [Clostridia bacterium]|nr:ParB/RepB/Spo0J family partition protein [Clostridia bacterium]MBQ6325975.1 ParB/RepB/Spo0J family partition protein [Clostridia bacterium]MBQ9040464.1 ParB/RepB/Spo0J family partition protein [Clostridia bacterium]
MAKKIQRGLGRGLGALLGDDVVAEAPLPAETGQPQEPVDAVRMLPIGQIDPNRDQPRRSFDEEGLKELAASIEAVGVLQPIIVAPSGDRFTIIAGERRYRASRLAGLDEIPAIVRDWDSQKRLEAALIENLQRDDLNPVEEAMGVRQLMDEAGLTQEKAAERLGKSRPAVANLLRLLTLPESVKQLLAEGKLSAGHARALVTVEPRRQVQLANLTVQQGWSVRQLERICAQPVKEEGPKARKVRDAQIGELENMARELFGTRVRLDGTNDSGRITLFYYNSDDLQRIWDVLEMAREK